MNCGLINFGSNGYPMGLQMLPAQGAYLISWDPRVKPSRVVQPSDMIAIGDSELEGFILTGSWDGRHRP